MDWCIGVTDLLSPDKCTLLLIDHRACNLLVYRTSTARCSKGKHIG